MSVRLGLGIALEPLQVGAHLRSFLIAQPRLFFERTGDDPIELRRKRGIQAQRRDGIAIENRLENHSGRFAAEWPAAGGHFIKDHAEREKVAAHVDVFAARLLGRHVGDGAHRSVRTRETFPANARCGSGGRAHRFAHAGLPIGWLRETKIQNLGTALREENIGGLDVAMHDAFRMSSVESAGHLHRDVEQFVHRHRLAIDAMPQRLAFEQLHDDERTGVLLVNLMNGADVGIVQRGCGAGFALKSLESLGVLGQFVGKEFQSDIAAEAQILGLIDNTHPAATELLNDPVMRDGLADHLRI